MNKVVVLVIFGSAREWSEYVWRMGSDGGGCDSGTHHTTQRYRNENVDGDDRVYCAISIIDKCHE